MCWGFLIHWAFQKKQFRGDEMVDFDKELDATGLSCPLPLLRAKQALAGMSSGQVLHVMASDPGSARDFPAFAKQAGHELLEAAEKDGTFHYVIRKA